MPAIRIENGPQAGAVFPVGKERISIGREETATIRVLDAGVSRDHAEIFRVGGMCFVKDLDSRNGTYVGEEPIAEELLQYGDRIRVGSTVLVFEEDAPAGGLRKEGPPDVGGTTVEVSLDAPPGAEPQILDRRLETLFRLAGAVVAARGVDVLAQDAIKAVVESLAPDAAFVYLKDEETGRLTVRASFERDPDVRTPLSRTLVQRVLREKKAVLTTDLGRDNRFSANESAVANVGQSILCTPLGSSGGILGVLYLQTGEGTRPYEPPDLELASTLGIVVGTALHAHFARSREHRLLLDAARALVAIGEAVDPGAPAHAERVYTYAAAAAKELGLSRKAAVQAELAALLHDVGKGLPGPEGEGPPEPARHAVQGATFVARIAALAPVAPGIRHHHERWDGAGVPESLAGEAIPHAARIVAVADFFDHVTASRETGGEGLDVKSALGRLDEEAGTTFDREVVEAVRAAYQRGDLFAPRPCLEEGLDEP